MIIGDHEYNRHFVNMVKEGIICGLTHPIEWITSYSRGIGLPYTGLSELNGFVDLVWGEMFKIHFLRPAKDISEIQSWIDSYYKKEK